MCRQLQVDINVLYECVMYEVVICVDCILLCAEGGLPLTCCVGGGRECISYHSPAAHSHCHDDDSDS